MKTLFDRSNGISNASAQREAARGWQRWTPYAAIAWSLIYAALGVYWAVSGHGFPYAPESVFDGMGPLIERFGQDVVWVIVIMAGGPAVVMGVAMVCGVYNKIFRFLFITAGALLAVVLLLLMTDINLLIMIGYIPYAIRSLFVDADFSQRYFQGWTQWPMIHQLICLTGGFLWLATTVSYSRRSMDACLYCGRRDYREGWQNSEQAVLRWSKVAIYVAMVAPVFYTLTRYAWASGIPLGISEEVLRQGQKNGTWTSGLFLATFSLVGALLMLGLVQRWGEIFPWWMIGLAGRRVPIALAVAPASLVSVLLIVGGITMWSGIDQMVAISTDAGTVGIRLIWEMVVMVGPILLFPVWGAALAIATLGYYYRRRGPCNVCGRGTSEERETIPAPIHSLRN